MTSTTVQRTYIGLMFGNTLAASLIWGINTIFLLDAGLSNFEAFAANAFFTAGMVLFEIPTGIIADTWGRRASYLLGTITLALSTLFYVLLWQAGAPFWLWALSSLLLGLGFTFFSGAVEAWLVDALKATGYTGELETVFGRGQIAMGVAMLGGSIAGGIIAQATNLGVPYLLRGAILVIMFVAAWVLMRDIGFTPSRTKQPLRDMKQLLQASVDHGLRNPPVRWIMLSALAASGVGFYTFYALQPYLLELYGNPNAYGIAGLVAAAVAGAQIAGGITAPYIRKLFRRRTSALLLGSVVVTAILVLFGLTGSFAAAVVLVIVWGLLFSALMPIRQAYLNSLIPSKQRATVLSFDSLMGSSGGVVTQPALGRVADVYSYSTSFVIGGAINVLSLPFLVLARRVDTLADIKTAGAGKV